MKEARFEGTPLGPLGRLGPPRFCEFQFQSNWCLFLPELHYTAVAPAFAEPELPPESWEAMLPGTLGSPPAPERDD